MVLLGGCATSEIVRDPALDSTPMGECATAVRVVFTDQAYSSRSSNAWLDGLRTERSPPVPPAPSLTDARNKRVLKAAASDPKLSAIADEFLVNPEAEKFARFRGLVSGNSVERLRLALLAVQGIDLGVESLPLQLRRTIWRMTQNYFPGERILPVQLRARNARFPRFFPPFTDPAELFYLRVGNFDEAKRTFQEGLVSPFRRLNLPGTAEIETEILRDPELFYAIIDQNFMPGLFQKHFAPALRSTSDRAFINRAIDANLELLRDGHLSEFSLLRLKPDSAVPIGGSDSIEFVQFGAVEGESVHEIFHFRRNGESIIVTRIERDARGQVKLFPASMHEVYGGTGR